jgi:hypothetical protein
MTDATRHDKASSHDHHRVSAARYLTSTTVSEGTTANKQPTKFLNRPVLTQFPIEKERSTHGKRQLQRSKKHFEGVYDHWGYKAPR